MCFCGVLQLRQRFAYNELGNLSRRVVYARFYGVRRIPLMTECFVNLAEDPNRDISKFKSFQSMVYWKLDPPTLSQPLRIASRCEKSALRGAAGGFVKRKIFLASLRS